MTLVVHELDPHIDQSVTPDRNTIIEAIRPHIYRHNFATGSLKLQIRDSLDSLVAESESIDIADIGSMAFFHGYVRFYIDAYLQGGESYTIRLIGGDGYTFDESTYCGWVNGYDLAKYPSITIPTKGVFHPLDLEIWERTTK